MVPTNRFDSITNIHRDLVILFIFKAEGHVTYREIGVFGVRTNTKTIYGTNLDKLFFLLRRQSEYLSSTDGVAKIFIDDATGEMVSKK